MFAILFLVAGILTSFFYGTLLDKYQCYRKMLMVICFSSGVIFIMCIFTIPSKNVVLAAMSFMLVGVGMIPIMSVAYSFSVELTYPLPEALTNGMMISLSLIWGTLQGLLDGFLSDVSSGMDPRYVMVLWIVTSFIAGFVAYFIKCKHYFKVLTVLQRI